MRRQRATTQERFIARKRRETLGRRSSLRGPAHTIRAREKAGPLRSGRRATCYYFFWGAGAGCSLVGGTMFLRRM